MKILLVGDCIMPTGFGRVNEALLTQLCARGWDAACLAVNYSGDPVEPRRPWRLYPADNGGDMLGINRLEHVVEREKPDVIFITTDSWVVPLYFPGLTQTKAPLVAYMFPDAPNQYKAKALNDRVQLCLAATQFGADELRLGGFTGPIDVLYSGVDTQTFYPVSRAEARSRLKMPEHIQRGYIVGNVNRNQPRKRFDLTMRAWRAFWEATGRDDTIWLLLHTAEIDAGWNIRQLGEYYGINERIILTGSINQTSFAPEVKLRCVYNACDVMMSTTTGEGWGLPTMEGMACGVPQIVPEWSALSEWPRGAVRYVPISDTLVGLGGINTVGGVPSVDAMAAELLAFYRDAKLRADMGAAGLARVNESRFTWHAIGEKLDGLLRKVVTDARDAAA